jgi:sugar phosphate isomerase/epimerase
MAGSGSKPGFSQSKGAKPMKLSFTTLGCPDWTLRQIVENAAQMGYDGVDLRGLQDEIDISKTREFTTGLNGTKALFADHGVAISGIAISARYAVVDAAEKERHFDETRRNMELAARLGAHILRVYGGKVPEGHTVDSIMPTLVENLRQIGDEAEQYDVTLALETHDDWTDSSVFRRLMDEANHPRVRVLWDLHHPYRTTGRGHVPEPGPLHGQYPFQGLRPQPRREPHLCPARRRRCAPQSNDRHAGRGRL